MYEKIFAEYGEIVAQVLLTREDIETRGRYLNARNTLLTLLRLGVIPIINENDTVAYEEIKFGENDTLASLVAGLADADLVVLLSDIPSSPASPAGPPTLGACHSTDPSAETAERAAAICSRHCARLMPECWFASMTSTLGASTDNAPAPTITRILLSSIRIRCTTPDKSQA
jgi:hypothetical protein